MKNRSSLRKIFQVINCTKKKIDKNPNITYCYIFASIDCSSPCISTHTNTFEYIIISHEENIVENIRTSIRCRAATISTFWKCHRCIFLVPRWDKFILVSIYLFTTTGKFDSSARDLREIWRCQSDIKSRVNIVSAIRDSLNAN